MFNWDISRVASVVNARATEGQSLEFKSELPASNDRGKAEFLKDVSSFANSTGGAILFGISEEAGAAESLSGLTFADPDAEVRRLSQVLESGLEPRVAGIQFNALTLGESTVFVVDVPQSFDAPHRYLFNGHSKFVQRVGSHVSELTYEQLRSAFGRTSGRIEKLRRQWTDQLTFQNLWRPMIDGPVCVVRLASVMAADEVQIIDPKEAYNHWSDLIFPDWGGGSPSFNYEGLVASQSRDNGQHGAMVQVHRHGMISAYRTARTLSSDEPLIPSTAVGDFISQASKKLIDFALSVGLRGSAVLNVGLVRLSGYSFATRDHHGIDAQVIAGVEEIQMPEFWLDDLQNPGSIDQILRPGFDVLWQAFGWPECPHFNADGNWAPR